MTDCYVRCTMTWHPGAWTTLWASCSVNNGPHVCHHHEAEMHVCACGSRAQGIVASSS